MRIYVSTEMLKILACSLVVSHIDYANEILPVDSVLKKLQLIQNWVVKMTLKQRKFDSASLALCTLHWLPVYQ